MMKESQKKLVALGALLLMVILAFSPGVSGSSSSVQQSSYSVSKNPFDAIQAYYTHAAGLFYSAGILFNFSHTPQGTWVRFATSTGETVGGFLISRTATGVLISNAEGKIAINKANATIVDPTINYLAYVLYGVPNPNPGHGSFSECSFTWTSFLYGGSGAGNLKLTWNLPHARTRLVLHHLCSWVLS